MAFRPTAATRQEQDDVFVCSSRTLEGVYGISISGTRPAPAPPSGIPNYVPGTIEQLIGVGTQTFDGHGSFTQITNEKGSLSGILFANRALQGTYTVNADCSGTITLAAYSGTSVRYRLRRGNSESWQGIPQHRRVTIGRDDLHRGPKRRLKFAKTELAKITVRSRSNAALSRGRRRRDNRCVPRSRDGLRRAK